MKNTEEAKDMAQEVFIHVYQNTSKFKGESLMSTWIYRIAVNKCLEEIRRRGRQKRSAELQDVDDSVVQNKVTDFQHPGIALENKERAAVLVNAIDQLPEQQKVAFTLAKVEHLSYEEIGKIMKKSSSSVESLIFRAKQNLKKLLEDYYGKI